MKNQLVRVLSIDGGGMRGLYSAAYLEGLVDLAQKRFEADLADFGKQFDLIIGTSTGAIIGCGLAAGIPLSGICSLYTSRGKEIFPTPLPSNIFKLIFHRRKSLNKRGELALRKALEETFSNQTLASVYKDRKIGLVVPAVNCTTHKAWLFKTAHDPDSNRRDDDYSLVDVCLASSAAPVYRSLAAIKQPGKSSTNDIFADGGLWANNPVLIALIEALRISEPDTSIEIFSLGTSPAPAGNVLDKDDPHWGLREWRFGGAAVELALDSQTWVHDQMSKMLIRHLDRTVRIVRFPQPVPSARQSDLLGIDNTSREANDLLMQFAANAVDETNQMLNCGSGEGKLIGRLLGMAEEKNAARIATF